MLRRCVWSRNIKNGCSIYIYIYIYDISRLKVNNLTLILLTWRKWWAPNNASKYQMGFNSGFKGLNIFIHVFLYMGLAHEGCEYLTAVSHTELQSVWTQTASCPFNHSAELSESHVNPHISMTICYGYALRMLTSYYTNLTPLAMTDAIPKEMFLGHIVAYTGTPLSSSVAFFSLVTSRAHVGASV